MNQTQKNICNSEVYRYYERKPQKLEGSALTALVLLEVFVNPDIIVSKKSKHISNVCEFLKANYQISCNDERLHLIVKECYEKISYYERKVSNPLDKFNDPSQYIAVPAFVCCLKPWYQIVYSKRMRGVA